MMVVKPSMVANIFCGNEELVSGLLCTLTRKLFIYPQNDHEGRHLELVCSLNNITITAPRISSP